MRAGELIRKYRRMRGMTQLQLADMWGLSDSAVRNYELGNRTPSAAHLDLITKALEIAPEAFLEVDVASARQALEYLFRIDEELGLKPAEGEDGRMSLAIDPSSPKSPKLQSALEAWRTQLDRLDAGEMDRTEYDIWRASLQ